VELLQIGQVAKEYGVSIRLVRYYEELGFIQSQRKGDGAYRVYDEHNIQRLRQIIVLRKLRIPVKQIGEILDNPNTAVIVDIFKRNIDELDDEITSLATIKRILSQFVEKLSETAQIKLEINFAADNSILSVIETLSFIKSNNHKKENFMMEQTINDLSKADAKLNKLSDNDVKIVYLPPATMASSVGIGDNGIAEDVSFEEIRKFTKNINLFCIYPGTRCFGFDARVNNKHAYEVWQTIPDGLNVPEPLTKKQFGGGLYALYTIKPFDLDKRYLLNDWVKESAEYARDKSRVILEEHPSATESIGIKGHNGTPQYMDYLVPIYN